MKLIKNIALVLLIGGASIGLWEGGKLVYRYFFPWEKGELPLVTLGNSTPHRLTATFFNDKEEYQVIIEPCRTCKSSYGFKENTCTPDTSYKMFNLNPTKYQMRLVFDFGKKGQSGASFIPMDLTRSNYSDCIVLTDR